jgi:flagellar motor switch protein FliN/FliY
MMPDRDLDVIGGISVRVSVEAGSCTMPIAQLLKLGTGSLVALDRAAGSAVDLLVNGTLLARGEIVAIDDKYGLRITEVVVHAAPVNAR